MWKRNHWNSEKVMTKTLSRDMRFPTMWYVRPAKAQINQRIRAVWSESLLVCWILYGSLATDWTSFGVSKLKGGRPVYTCQNATLLEITCDDVATEMEYSMSVKLLTEHHLEFLIPKGGCPGSSESTHVKMPHCWKSRVMAHICLHTCILSIITLYLKTLFL